MQKTDFNFGEAFGNIELDLIRSMIDNLAKHKVEDVGNTEEWQEWRVKQLRELEQYRRDNADKFGDEFEKINADVDKMFREARDKASDDHERKILDELRLKMSETPDNKTLGGINEKQLEALIEATTKDLEKAEWSVLRRADDEYRNVITNAMLYAETTGNYNKAIDMAVKDFVGSGIDCVVYGNGSRHSLREYAGMAIRTGTKRAQLIGIGKTNQKLGIHTIRINKRTDACPLCMKWVGRVLVDDVYSGGTEEEAEQLGYPTLSTAMAMGLYHPNCKDIHAPYIEGISKPSDPWTKQELEELAERENLEQERKQAESKAEQYERLEEFALDEDNKKEYAQRVKEWDEKAKSQSRPLRKNAIKSKDRTRLTQALKDKGFSASQQSDLSRYIMDLDEKERQAWIDEIESTNYLFSAKLGSEKTVAGGDVKINKQSSAYTVIHETMHSIDRRWKFEYDYNGNIGKLRPSACVDLDVSPDDVYDSVASYLKYDVRSGDKIIKRNARNKGAFKSYMEGLAQRYYRIQDKFADFDEARSDLSDIISGITTNATGGEQEYGYHPSKYWNAHPFLTTDADIIFLYNAPTMATREALAEYATIRLVYPRLLDELEKLAPDYYYALEEAYYDSLGL